MLLPNSPDVVCGLGSANTRVDGSRSLPPGPVGLPYVVEAASTDGIPAEVNVLNSGAGMTTGSPINAGLFDEGVDTGAGSGPLVELTVVFRAT